MLIVFGIPIVLFGIGYVLALKLTIAWQIVVTVCGLMYYMNTVRSDSKEGLQGLMAIGMTFVWIVLPTLAGAVVGNLVYHAVHGTFNGGTNIFDTAKWLVTP